MEKAKVLAFLLCEKASKGADGKITLHGLFDRIITPRAPRDVKIFFVFYKVVVREPCAIALKVVGPSGREIPGSWRDSLSETGPMQTIWALTSTLFKQAGPYVLELRQEADGTEPLPLASMSLLVEQQEN